MHKILFRCDSSSIIGLGHVKRDLVLAKQYKNSQITFAVQDLRGNINKEIEENAYKVHTLKSARIEELLVVIQEQDINLLIIDSYSFTYEEEKRIKKECSCTLMVLDDTYEKHYCDILLNHNIYAQEKKYEGLVPSSCELLCGSDYTLIRDEFKNIKAKKVKNLKPRVLICMGGVDAGNISYDVIKVLLQFEALNIDLVTSSSNKQLKQLQGLSSDSLSLHIDTKEMASLIFSCSFAIVSPSVIVHEVMFLKKKFLSIQTASNQEYMHEYLKTKDYMCMSSFSSKILYTYVNRLLEENE